MWYPEAAAEAAAAAAAVVVGAAAVEAAAAEKGAVKAVRALDSAEVAMVESSQCKRLRSSLGRLE